VEKITNAYSVKVGNFTASAEEKLKAVGGEIVQSSTDEKPEEA
jgi:large subunit ribosomal protein L15